MTIGKGRPASRPSLLATLEDQGYKLTTPRRRVVGVLEEKNRGFTAAEIATEVAGVARATVFRTVKILVAAGVVCRLSLPDGAPRYSRARIEHHHHTVCIRCGEIGEFRASTVERLIRTIGTEISGRIVGHNIELHIVCYDCIYLNNF